MGTRHLIAVMYEGKYKVAQYGQWDGYSQGDHILDFLKNKSLIKFVKQLEKCYFASDDELKSTWDEFGGLDAHGCIGYEKARRRDAKYPSLSRDAGSGIFDLIQNTTDRVPLRDDITFAADSLFCEYAYVVDFDKRTFEAYRGFNENPVPAGERFADMPRDTDSKYYPVRLVASWSLDELPTQADYSKAMTADDEEEAT